MLSVTAHTFRQKARLAVSLAWIGGFVDTIGFILLAGVFTSNMTGNTAALGQRLAETLESADGAGVLALRALFTVGMFLAGALLSGIITVGGQRRRIQSIYSMALSVEMVLLASFLVVANSRPEDGSAGFSYLLVALGAVAMGLQNATITQIAGAVVRTTHVTGVITDLGLESIQLLFWFRDRTRGNFRQRLSKAFALSPRHPSFQRLFLLISIWGGFLAGAVLGVLTLRHFGASALVLPIGFLIFIIGLDFLRPIAIVSRVQHQAQGHDQELKTFGIDPGSLPRNVGVYRIRAGGRRRRRKAPDLGKLLEQASHEVDVVLFLLGDDFEVDENHLAGLVHALRAIRTVRPLELVLCIMKSELYTRVSRHEVAEEIGRANICPDPEFAVARMIELADPMTATK